MFDRHSQVAGLSISPEISRKSDLRSMKFFGDPIRGSSHVFRIRIRSVMSVCTAIRVSLRRKNKFLHFSNTNSNNKWVQGGKRPDTIFLWEKKQRSNEIHKSKVKKSTRLTYSSDLYIRSTVYSYYVLYQFGRIYFNVPHGCLYNKDKSFVPDLLFTMASPVVFRNTYNKTVATD